MIPKFSAPVFGAQTKVTLPSADLGGGAGTASLLTQPLQILHRSLVALQGRVGLGGLIQEHLQSCARCTTTTQKKSSNLVSVWVMRAEGNPLWFYINALSTARDASACVLTGGREQLGEEKRQSGLASPGEQITAAQSDENQLGSQPERPVEPGQKPLGPRVDEE